MALLIKPLVSSKAGLEKEGCYIQVKPYLPYDLKNIPVDIGIWGTKNEFESNINNPNIEQLNEVRKAYYLNPETAGDIYEGKNILYKMLMWSNEAVKAIILQDNPEWKNDDIEIVDIPKI